MTDKKTRIRHVTSLRPDRVYQTEEILEVAQKQWFSKMDELSARKARKIMKAAGITSRASVVDLETVFSDLSFEKKNDLYIEAMISMGHRVFQKALEESGTDPREIDYIITTSCTGFMIPSVDAYLINSMGLRQDVGRLPVTEMGCAGGTSGLIYADHFLQANPGKTVALLNLEMPSLTFQKQDMSVENLVSTAIFADGASCTILDTESFGAKIGGHKMYHFPHATHLMGYRLQDDGLKIVLDKDVPNQIREHFPNILEPFLETHNLSVGEVNHYIFHPGGKKIIEMVKDYVGRFDKDVSLSIEVLQEMGNMSSATIMHILERTLKENSPHVGDKGYMLAFGPGFVAQSILLEWEE